MSFSNADTGEIPPDPYKAKNLDEASIQDKVEGLSEFVSACKFSMMTTRDGRTGDLVSRCMALAAKVCLSLFNVGWHPAKIDRSRNLVVSTSSFIQTLKPAKLMTLSRTNMLMSPSSIALGSGLQYLVQHPLSLTAPL